MAISFQDLIAVNELQEVVDEVWSEEGTVEVLDSVFLLAKDIPKLM